MMPALATRQSTRPHAATTAAIIDSTSARRLTSTLKNSTSRPSSRSSAAVSRKPVSSMSQRATFAPSLVILIAIALPIPAAAPVTTQTFSFSLIAVHPHHLNCTFPRCIRKTSPFGNDL